MSPTKYIYETLEPSMGKVYALVNSLGNSQSTILIEGPSGCGKEALCQLIHQLDSTSTAGIHPINCSAIPENLIESELFGYEAGSFTGADGLKIGRFESSGQGTIILDDISEMNLKTQAKLLRVLETREFYRVGGHTPIRLHSRLIVTTNKNLNQLVQQGKFREDLYHRLNVVHINVPSLAERCRDIPLLVDHFLAELNEETNRRIRLSPEVYHFLCQKNWEGNIRELRNFITRLSYLANHDLVTIHDLGTETWGFENNPSFFAVTDQSLPLDVLEKKYILHTMNRVRGNKSKAARELNISLKTLRTKLKEYNFEAQSPVFLMKRSNEDKGKNLRGF